MKNKGISIFLRVVFSAALTAGLVFGATRRASAVSIVYVKYNAIGANNGTSWKNAYRYLQPALTKAALLGTGTQIWVAGGTYKPTIASDSLDRRTKTFQLKNGIGVYGGFNGTETLLSQRKPSVYITILTGDIGYAGNQSDNSYHVVTATYTASNTVLDGFTIQSGYANGAGAAGQGAGIYIFSGNPTLKNLILKVNYADTGGGLWVFNGNPTVTAVTFDKNHATSFGGGAYVAGSVAKFTNVTFTSNQADINGGGLFNTTNATSTVTSATFTGNKAGTNGGGLFSDSGLVRLNTVTFTGNQAVGDGGGQFVDTGATSLSSVTFSGNTATNGGGIYMHETGPALTKVTFRYNTATANGGAIFNDGLSAHPTLTNVTFSGNFALSNSGGMYNSGNDPLLVNNTFNANTGAMYNTNSDPTIRNSVLWADGIEEIVDSTSNVVIVDSIVSGAIPGAADCLADGSNCTNVIIGNPRLGALQNNGGATQTMALGVGSAALDAGGGHAACAGRDQRDVLRPQGDACDMGAYEVRVKTFTSQAAYDGWVLESSKGSGVGDDDESTGTEFNVGDDASNRQYRGFLSFDTSALPDTASIMVARIKLKQAGVYWDPFGSLGTLWIDVARPYFGDSVDLVSGDFEATATVAKAGTVSSTLSPDGYYTGLLTGTGRTYINKTGVTQLRLRFDTASDNNSLPAYLVIASSNTTTTDFQPKLILYYNP